MFGDMTGPVYLTKNMLFLLRNTIILRSKFQTEECILTKSLFGNFIWQQCKCLDLLLKAGYKLQHVLKIWISVFKNQWCCCCLHCATKFSHYTSGLLSGSGHLLWENETWIKCQVQFASMTSNKLLQSIVFWINVFISHWISLWVVIQVEVKHLWYFLLCLTFHK